MLGTLNRYKLLKAAIESIRNNGFNGNYEIIVVDGGSNDGTAAWLARQCDILTIIQPNTKILTKGGLRRLHSWGNFMNYGFKAARANWILMMSDDVLLCRGCISIGLSKIREHSLGGTNIGGGAIFWRDYPKDIDYHVKVIEGGYIHINHGFYNREALEHVGYFNEDEYEFYGADGDMSISLNEKGWPTVALDGSYAEHLNHRAKYYNIIKWFFGLRVLSANNPDLIILREKYKHLNGEAFAPIVRKWKDPNKVARCFILKAPVECIQGWLRRLIKKNYGKIY